MATRLQFALIDRVFASKHRCDIARYLCVFNDQRQVKREKEKQTSDGFSAAVDIEKTGPVSAD